MTIKETSGPAHSADLPGRRVSEVVDAKPSLARSGEFVEVRMWSRGLRITHWLNLIGIVGLSITGYYIMSPYFTVAPGDAFQAGFRMGWIRFLHFTFAFAWISVAILRVYMLFASSKKQGRWKTLWPWWSKDDWKGMWQTLAYYLFLRKEEPRYLAHNPLQRVTYSLVYLLCLVELCTGLSLFGLQMGIGNPIWYAISVPAMLIGVPVVRVIHVVIMYLIWTFVILHVYLVIRDEVISRSGALSSMIGGTKYVPADTVIVDADKLD
ncbi:MAG: Ni/Fe-hydrogenase, b-type cytochrome subunit [Corynebacterium sp.]|nr:Ni/Fe-hydrogenase, b-type cytochrome subunit [Corynebacterium sp.]